MSVMRHLAVTTRHDMSQVEEMQEGLAAIIYHARKAMDAVKDCDTQKIRLHLATIRVACDDTRKMIGDE